MYAYVGSRTTRDRNARGEGISVYWLDQERGILEMVQLLKGHVNPSYLTLNERADVLYAVHGDESDVSAFRIDSSSGRLSFLNTQDTQGKNPVHLAIAPAGKHLVVTNHIGASLAVFPINSDGCLGELSQLLELSGEPGPHRIEQPHAKPHYNLFSVDGQHVLVPDKGLDQIFSFRFDAGHLSAADEPSIATRETAGPRHMAFHPQGAMAYVINELDSTVTTYRYQARTGELSALQILSSLPASYTGNNRAAGIQVDKRGRFLYASNRGHDSIAVFSIDPQTALLSFIEATPSAGRTPRFFTLTPNGRYLFALNEDSDSIAAFAVNQEFGTLEATGFETISGSPVCMVFAP